MRSREQGSGIKKPICFICGKVLEKSTSRGPIYIVESDGCKEICEACDREYEQARHIAALEKTFDEPLHRGEI